MHVTNKTTTISEYYESKTWFLLLGKQKRDDPDDPYHAKPSSLAKLKLDSSSTLGKTLNGKKYQQILKTGLKKTESIPAPASGSCCN